jgi:hypothetical protein
VVVRERERERWERWEEDSPCWISQILHARCTFFIHDALFLQINDSCGSTQIFVVPLGVLCRQHRWKTTSTWIGCKPSGKSVTVVGHSCRALPPDRFVRVLRRRRWQTARSRSASKAGRWVYRKLFFEEVILEVVHTDETIFPCRLNLSPECRKLSLYFQFRLMR